MEETNLTPNVQITPDPESKEAELFNGEDNGREEQAAAPDIDYRQRYIESSKGAEQIALKAKELQTALEVERQTREAQEQRARELEEALMSQNPEGFDAYQVKKELSELKKDLVLQKEETSIARFVDSNPEAKAHKEALRALGRANPSKSYDELYNDYLKPAYEAGARDYEIKVKEKRTSQPETGKSAEPSPRTTSFDEQEFNKLSTEERRRRLIQMGY